MDKYISFYRKNLDIGRDSFIKKVNNIDKNTKIKEVEEAVKCLCLLGTGIYSSYKIEKYFLDKANKFSIKENICYEKNSILHVMTEAYTFGGHTRVVERWIMDSPAHEKHSVYIINQKEQINIPDLLKEVIKAKNGHLFVDNNNAYMKKSYTLRKEAMKYEKIVLHVHFDDYVPLIAFGSEEFTRPIIYYNHADHLGWLGISIADIVADLRDCGHKITIEKRHAKKSIKLGIPVLHQTKKQVAIKTDKSKIHILTFAREEKFKPIQDINIFKLIKKITDKYENIIFTIIGIKERNDYLLEANINNNKLIVKSIMSHNELMEYISQCDIVLDSFPMAGGTAMLDAVYMEKPVLSGLSFVGQLDYIMKSNYYMDSMDEMYNMLCMLIESEEKRKNNIEEIKRLLDENDSIECFKRNLNIIYKQLPKEHEIYHFKDEYGDYTLEDIYRYRTYSQELKSKIIIKTKWITIKKEKNSFNKWIVFKILDKEYRIQRTKTNV